MITINDKNSRGTESDFHHINSPNLTADAQKAKLSTITRLIRYENFFFLLKLCSASELNKTT